VSLPQRHGVTIVVAAFYAAAMGCSLDYSAFSVQSETGGAGANTGLGASGGESVGGAGGKASTGGASSTGGSGGLGAMGGTGGSAAAGGMGGQGGQGPVCGDGTADGGEECDDGGLVDGDGCSMDCEVVCPGGWTEDPDIDHCYRTFNDTQSYAQSVVECATNGIGFHLVTVVDLAELNFVNALNNSNQYWIGANDMDVEGTFVWITGEPFTWVNGANPPWAGVEPNNANGNENCVILRGSENDFNDFGCGAQVPRICEYTPPGF